MLIKIYRDAFDIVNRIKKIDSGYFLCYNTKTQGLEVHNKKQKHTFCLSVPYSGVDCRILSLILKSRKENFDKILKEIDEHNDYLEKEQKRKMLDKSSFMLNEMFSYAQHHEGDVDFKNAYKTKWA